MCTGEFGKIQICFQFVEKSSDGERDWGAHVREDDVPLDEVKILKTPCYSTIMSGKVYSP